MLWTYASPFVCIPTALDLHPAFKINGYVYIGSIPASLDFTIYCQICQIPIVSKSSFALQAYSHFFIYTESSLVEQSTPRSHLIFDAQVGLDGMGWPGLSIDG